MEKKQSSINAFFGKKRKRDDDELEYVAGSSHQVEAEPAPTADESKSDDQPSGSAAADVAINVPELHSIDIGTVAVLPFLSLSLSIFASAKAAVTFSFGRPKVPFCM